MVYLLARQGAAADSRIDGQEEDHVGALDTVDRSLGFGWVQRHGPSRQDLVKRTVQRELLSRLYHYWHPDLLEIVYQVDCRHFELHGVGILQPKM